MPMEIFKLQSKCNPYLIHTNIHFIIFGKSICLVEMKRYGQKKRV